ncbi:MAG: hypothetical protein KDE31_35470, partial [Caldilineaceae bacterium]|nr:hypothetical protein [Caldilineaceae bacterium]
MNTNEQRIPASALPISFQWVDHLQQNFITYFRLFAGLPGITFAEEAVIWSAGQGDIILSTQLADSDLDQQIDKTLHRIGQHTDAVDWMVFPACRPVDLGERLRKRGEVGGPAGEWMLHGQIGGPGGNWMWLDLTTLGAPPATPDGFHVKQVINQAMFDEWTVINATGFGADDYSAFHAAYSRHGFGPDAQAIHFIGYVGTAAVTSATLLVAGGSASVYNVSTPTALRRQGLGGAITHAALQVARARGYRDTWIWASDLGKSVYAK